MKLYLVSQDVNNGYDTFDSFVVACDNEEEAKHTSPSKDYRWHDGTWWIQLPNGSEESTEVVSQAWCKPDDAYVKLLGEAAPGVTGIICASYNAG